MRHKASAEILPKQPNQSVIDGIRCLQAVVNQEGPVGVSDVARELDLETTRVHRLLRTLTHMGLLDLAKGRKYTPGPALPVLAAQTLHAIRLPGVPISLLNEFQKSTGMLVAMGVRWQRQVSYLYHREPDERADQAVGNFQAWPAEISGLGVAMLAHLNDNELRHLYAHHPIEHFSLDDLVALVRETRANGYCYLFPTNGRRTLAIRMEHNPNMALGMAGPIAPHQVTHYLDLLRQVAASVEHALQDGANRSSNKKK